jgi:hypothetical protein
LFAPSTTSKTKTCSEIEESFIVDKREKKKQQASELQAVSSVFLNCNKVASLNLTQVPLYTQYIGHFASTPTLFHNQLIKGRIDHQSIMFKNTITSIFLVLLSVSCSVVAFTTPSSSGTTASRLAATSLNMAKYDKAAEKWITTTEDERTGGYGPFGTLIR